MKHLHSQISVSQREKNEHKFITRNRVKFQNSTNEKVLKTAVKNERSSPRARVSMTTEVSVATVEARKQWDWGFITFKERTGRPRNVNTPKLKCVFKLKK